MTARLNIMKLSGLRELFNNINPLFYEKGDADALPVADSSDYVRETMIEITGDISNCLLLPEKDNDHDVENCSSICRVLDSLTLQQAADKRVWVYLTHFVFFDYVRARWPMPFRKSAESDEDWHTRKIRHIKAHYFVGSTRGLIRDNAISRLLWIGRVAGRCKNFSQEQALRILLKRADVRANLLERPTLSMSEEIFNAVMFVLGEDYKNKKDEGLFGRLAFREFMKQLNRTGGSRMLNILPERVLLDLVAEIGRKAKTVPD